MATGMKHWLGFMAAGFALVAVWRLPPEVMEPPTRAEHVFEETRFRALDAELKTSFAALRSIRWADSLRAFASEVEPGGLGIIAPAELDGTRRLSDFETQLGRVTAAIQPRDPSIALLYVFQPILHGLDPSIRTSMQGRTETLIGEHEGTRFCMRIRAATDVEEAVRRDTEMILGNWMSIHTPLGICAFYAKHGVPSRSVEAWLERGGAGYSSGRVEVRSDYEPYVRGRRAMFGTDLYIGSRSDLRLERCMAGYSEECASLFIDPSTRGRISSRAVEEARRSPSLTVRDGLGALGIQSPYLLGDLEAEFGVEAFRSFWRSDQTIPDAFLGAFGLPVEQWLVRWLDEVQGIDEPGPKLARANLLGTILVLSLFGALATLRTRKRRIA